MICASPPLLSLQPISLPPPVSLAYPLPNHQEEVRPTLLLLLPLPPPIISLSNQQMTPTSPQLCLMFSRPRRRFLVGEVRPVQDIRGVVGEEGMLLIPPHPLQSLVCVC